MITERGLSQNVSIQAPARSLGAVGYLAICACSVAAVMIARAESLPYVALACLLVALLACPQAFRSVIRFRLLVMMVLFLLPPVFLIGEPDRSLFGIGYSSQGFESASQAAARVLVVLVAIQGLNHSVDISSVAGLLERAGMHGLGFSVGVALNLLPALLQSAQNTWRSMRMRGGMRKQRRRASLLLAVTIATGVLIRAEEIGLAAEARGFTPDRSRSMPVRAGKWDRAVLLLGLAALLGLILAA